LAQAVSDEMGMTLSAVLIAEWWVVKTTKDKYGGLMEAGGDNLRILFNLPLFHNRVMLIYPNNAARIKVSDINENSINLHYFSKERDFRIL
jgi:hypothetical protein